MTNKQKTDEDIEHLDLNDLPDDAFILQSGAVVTDDGVIGRIEREEPSLSDL